MSRQRRHFLLNRVLLCGCALLLAATACAAQQTSAGAPAAKETDMSPAATATLNRKIEVMIRSELSVPPQYDLTIGGRQKSDVAGFDTIPVTFSLPAEPSRSQTVDFLLSKDGNTLARLSKWDIGPDPGSSLPTEGRPVRGNPQAKVTIVNFDDLECPYCARMHAEFFPAALDRYKGLIKFVYLDYPLVEIHPWAMHAAVDANCLAAQNDAAYWNYVDYLHTHGQDVSGADNDPAKAAAALDKLAEQEGDREHVDAAKLLACVTKQDDSRIVAEMKAGDKVGVNATPTFFVNGERWAGQLEEPELWTMIDRALRAQGVTPPEQEAPQPAAVGHGAK
jgi:protein-disulfide isomerase